VKNLSFHAATVALRGDCIGLRPKRDSLRRWWLPSCVWTVWGCSDGAQDSLTLARLGDAFLPSINFAAMRDDYLKDAKKVITDPNLLINVVSRRVKQLKRGSRPLVESLEKLALEDIALREVIEGKITYEQPDFANTAR
jgi:DNA-directed RNA polymerase subunit omega